MLHKLQRLLCRIFGQKTKTLQTNMSGNEAAKNQTNTYHVVHASRFPETDIAESGYRGYGPHGESHVR